MSAAFQWRAGFGRRDITPRESIWLGGFGTRTRASEGILHAIHAKTFAVADGSGLQVVLVSADILGFSTEMSGDIQRRAARRFGIPLECIVLSATHNHSSPVNTGIVPLIYNLSPQEQQKVDVYTETMKQAIVDAIGDALNSMQPASLGFAQGLAGIGVNRRRARPGCRGLPGPVDQDVPVLVVRNEKGHLKGVVFGYACHTTALSGYQVSGDYAGFAQMEIEKAHPNSVALFVPGCAGDINPLPRGTAERAEWHGKILAAAVCDIIPESGCLLSGPLRRQLGTARIPYSQVPTREDLERQLAETVSPEKWMLHFTTIVPPTQRLPHEAALKVAQTLTANERKSIRHQMSVLDGHGALAEDCALPLCLLDFGPELRWIHIGGEPVVDYSLLLKERYGWDNTWVSGYYHDLTCYIPSRRVLLEGDYEGTDGMREYGHPAPFDESIERRIMTEIDGLVEAGSTGILPVNESLHRQDACAPCET